MRDCARDLMHWIDAHDLSLWSKSFERSAFSSIDKTRAHQTSAPWTQPTQYAVDHAKNNQRR
jgi:hypothetical protein